MKQRWIFLIPLLLGLAIVPACTTSDTTLSATEILERAHQEMVAQSFRATCQVATEGIPGMPSQPLDEEAPGVLEYAPPDRIRSLSPTPKYEMPNNIIRLGEEVYVSENGIRWGTNIGVNSIAYLPILFDPREFLEHAKDAQDEGVATLNGSEHRIIRASFDGQGFVENKLTPVLRVHFPELKNMTPGDEVFFRSLGYEVFHVMRSFTWETRDRYVEQHFTCLTKEDICIEIIRYNDGEGYFNAHINNATSVSPEVERELKDILSSYGQATQIWEQVEIEPVFSEEAKADFIQGLESYSLRFWVDPESYLVSQMEVQQTTLLHDEQELTLVTTTTMSFTDYGEPIIIEKPEEVMLISQINALDDVIYYECLPALLAILEAYREREGHLPERLDPETMREVMEAESLKWPTNPFTGAPMKDKEDSLGDYHYALNPDGNYVLYNYVLYTYSWDDVYTSRIWTKLPLS